MIYNDASVRTIVWDERKRAGISNSRKKGLIQKVRELFDHGNGVVTSAEMLMALEDSDILHSPSTVRGYVQDLRKAYNLTGR